MKLKKTIHPVIKWAVSLRMFSIPFIILPFLLGIIVAVSSEGSKFNLLLTSIGFIPLLLNHLAANLQSDIFDFRKGIDVTPNYFSGGIVRKWITIKEARFVVAGLYSLAILVGIIMIVMFGSVLIPFVVLGFLLSIFYSAGDKFAFKYNVTGEWFIFLGFGILIPAYGFLLNTGYLSLEPILISLPAAFLIAAVKHANNWIAALTPGNLEKSTTAYLAGNTASRVYFNLMIVIPYLLMGFLVFYGDYFSLSIPGSILIIYLTLPVFIVLFLRALNNGLVNAKTRIYGLDSLTAFLYILFTGLCCISFLIG